MKILNNENICLASQVIEIAEHKTYLELTSRICYYDDVNANNMMLPYDDTSEDKANTLVNMPVQAKYKTNRTGEPTFGGHEMYKDSQGNVVFNTSSIGTHTEVFIEEDTITTVKGEVKTLPCLFAKYRIWKRYKNVIDAVKRLFDLNKLYSSWEILTSAYEFKDGVKKITDYVFEANTLLGFEYSTPSYGASASALSLATEGSQMIIAEALSHDLMNERLIFEATSQNMINKIASLKNDEGGKENSMKKKDIAEEIKDELEVKVPELENSTAEQDSDKSNTEPENDIAQLTDLDLWIKISKVCREKLGEWCYVAFHFPVEKEVWVETDSRESELDYVRFTYQVENDAVTISEPEQVKLTVSVRNMESAIAELNSKISQKDESIIKASEEIANLKTEISELQPYKEKFEVAEQTRIEKELAEKKEKLISSVTKSGLITKEEIEASEEFKGFVNSLDEKSLKAIVAERYIASLDKKEPSTDIASTQNVDVASTNLNAVEDDAVDKMEIMKKYLGGK